MNNPIQYRGEIIRIVRDKVLISALNESQENKFRFLEWVDYPENETLAVGDTGWLIDLNNRKIPFTFKKDTTPI